MKDRASFPSEEAVIKLMYLASRNVGGKWNMPIRDWASAMDRFAIMFEGRTPVDYLAAVYTDRRTLPLIRP